LRNKEDLIAIKKREVEVAQNELNKTLERLEANNG